VPRDYNGIFTPLTISGDDKNETEWELLDDTEIDQIIKRRT
jgi:hypothetical protein